MFSKRDISIARLNAKIYTQRNKLIDYQNIISEQKKQISHLRDLLKECGEKIESAYYFDGISKYDAREILTKIIYEIGDCKKK